MMTTPQEMNNTALQNDPKQSQVEPNQPLEAWETPHLIRLDVDLTETTSGGGADGGSFPFAFGS